MASAQLDIESHVQDIAGVVRVRGEIDLDTIEQLVDAISAVTPPGGEVEIDLCGVGFIDSAGIAGLNRCRRQALEVGTEVVVVCVEDGPVAKLLHWTGLERVIDVRFTPSA